MKKIFLFITLAMVILASGNSWALTEYYVDHNVTKSGDGSAIHPWKLRGNISWPLVQTAVNTGDVVIYFSSTATWSDNDSVNLPTTGFGSPQYTLTLDGTSRYNANPPTQTPLWKTNSDLKQRAIFARNGGVGGAIMLYNNTSHVTIRGFHQDHPSYAISLGSSNPTVNIDHILIDDMYIDSPVYNHGVWMGYAENGVHDIIVRNSTIINTPLEGVYLGHYNYMPPITCDAITKECTCGSSTSSCITGIIVENNTFIDIGSPGGLGSASINIKAPDYGAIVRNNLVYRTSSSPDNGATYKGSGCGMLIAGDNVQIYGNIVYGITNVNTGICGGHGIFLTANSDGHGNGNGLHHTLIYNNVLFGNEGSGIRMEGAKAIGTDNRDIKIYNNTIWGNGGWGIAATAYYGQVVEISELKNNILGNNTISNISFGGTTIDAADNNLYYSTTSGSWVYNKTLTWAQWQALGFDKNGFQNTDPLLVNPAGWDYHLLTNSPVIGKGINLSTEFTVDLDNNSRPATGSWDLGAYEYQVNVPGDVSGNGGVLIYDAALVLRDLLAGGNCTTLTSTQCAKAEMDGQGNGASIDGADVLDIAKKALGL